MRIAVSVVNEELAHVLRNTQSDSTIDNQWETIKTTITIAAKATIGKKRNDRKSEMDYTTYAGTHGGKKAVETTDN